MNRGVVVALAAYLLWGFSPAFWRLGTGDSVDIVVFRVLSTAVLLAVVQLVRDRGRSVRVALSERSVRRAMLATAALLATNWLAFIWAVTTDRVLEASLGYFLNPLVSVLLGVAVLGERLRRAQWSAIGIVTIGVVALSLTVSAVPLLSLFLAVTFGLYGLIRKVAPVGSLDGLSIEVVFLAPIAAVGLGLLSAQHGGAAVIDGSSDVVWIAGTSLMTAVPLLLFANAARQIDLSLVGILQYTVPTIQFFLGVFAYNEQWEASRLFGYGIIWLGLAVFAIDGLRRASRLVVQAG